MNEDAKSEFRAELEARFGEVWDTDQMRKLFTVRGFGGGVCVVIRESDGAIGSLDFTHMPRFYHSFQEG